MNLISATNKFNYHTFLAIIDTEPTNPNGLLDLEKLAKEFQLDISFNEDKLTLVNKNNEIVDQAFDICSSRFKNKQLEHNEQPSGFVKISYPRSPDTMIFTNPPDFIYNGTYCTICYNEGPHPHLKTCAAPKKSNLSLTFEGFIKFYLENEKAFNYKGTKVNKITNNEDILAFVEIIKKISLKKPLNKSDIIKQLDNFNDPYNEFDNSLSIIEKLSIDETKTNITLSDIHILTKKEKEGKYFSGPVMIKYYNQNQNQNTTIRVRSNGRIEIISNPWSLQYLYKEVISRINETSQKVIYKRSEIKSLFASVSMFDEEYFNIINKNTGPVMLNMEDIYNHFYSIKKKSEIIKNFQYSITKDKKSKNKVYFKMIPVINDVVLNCKISVQFFGQGPLQLTYCNELANNETKDISEVASSISDICYNIQQLLVKEILKIIQIKPEIIIYLEKKQLSKKIYETIDGSIPYAKRKKFKVSDQVNIFKFKTRSWSSFSGTVIEVLPNNEYKVSLDQKVKTYPHSKLRRIDPNNDQVCRFKENGIPRQPIPYSFLEGSCQGGLNQIMKPIGVISRSDNKWYPYCADIVNFKEELDWSVNFLLNGLTSEEKKFSFIDRSNNETGKEIDIYCGTFKPGTCQINNKILVRDLPNDNYISVQILDKFKTHGLGNDNNMVYYTVFSNDKNKEFNVCGRDFHPQYIENRNFIGLNNLDQTIVQEILMECARKLHLIENIPKKIGSLINKTFENSLPEIKILNAKNIKNLLNTNFSVAVIPENIEDVSRVSLIYDNGHIYLRYLDEIREISRYHNETLNITIDGYLTNDLKYYPITEISESIAEILSDLNKIKVIKQSTYYTKIDKIKFINSLLKNKNFIMFLTKKVYYQWSQMERRTLVLPLIYQNKNLWKVGIKDVLSCLDYSIPIADPDISIGTMVKIKPNIMTDCAINQLNPIIEVVKVPKEYYLGPEITQELVDNIMYAIPISMFLSSNNKWIIKEVYVEKDNLLVLS